MTKQYIQKRLNDLEANKAPGPKGLPMDKARVINTKVRWTCDEDDFFALMAEKMAVPKAVLLNALALDAAVQLLADDPELFSHVMNEWKALQRPHQQYFDEVCARRGEKPVIEGECRLVGTCCMPPTDTVRRVRHDR